MHNQDIIVRHFCKQREGFSSDLSELLVDKNKRWQLLTVSLMYIYCKKALISDSNITVFLQLLNVSFY